ncbi:MAG TPA: GNAT family N-acetyltransferase [Gaiellaceae bacterium]|jgi:predicted GNAT family acetyltransferase|nr:GNAT family N-acetyltransferase [Gaiellaceae bacterium]
MTATVRDNPAELRYELLVDGRRVGEIRYRVEGDATALVHTEVDPAYEGHGLGTQLVAGALRDLQERGRRVIPICPLVRAYLGRHPELAELVAPDPATPD